MIMNKDLEKQIKAVARKFDELNGMHLHILPEGMKPVLLIKFNRHIPQANMDKIRDDLIEIFNHNVTIIGTDESIDISIFPVINVYPEVTKHE